MMNMQPYLVESIRDISAWPRLRFRHLADSAAGEQSIAEPGAKTDRGLCLGATGGNIAVLVRGVRRRFPPAGETGNRYGVPLRSSLCCPRNGM